MIIGINCNLVLTKSKKKEDKEEELVKNEEPINKKERETQSYDSNSNNNGNTKNVTINEPILLSNKKNKYDSIKKETVFNKEINLLNSSS